MCRRSPQLGRWTGLLLLALALPVGAQVGGTFSSKGASKWPHFDEQNRLRSVVKFSDVKTTEGAVIRVENFAIEYYGENGALEVTAEAPECLFNVETRVAFSAGPLRAHSPDERFTLAGRGFRAQQAGSTLLLSNDVRALLQAGTNFAGRLPGAPARTNGPPLEITAATFEIGLSNNTAVFAGNVRADDPQFLLTAGRLTARFAGAGTNGALDALEAERDVVLTGKADGSRVTAERARYTVTNELVVLTGHPTFQQRTRAGRAERVTIDRRTRALEAEGAVALRAPREEISRSGFLLSTAGTTNAATGPDAGLVEIFSRRLVTRSNFTELEGDVRLLDGTNRLSTGRLTIETAGTNSTPVRAQAGDGLLVEQGTRRVKADRGTYERAGEAVTFYGRPEWTLDGVAGVADRLRVFPRTNAVEASGDLRLRFDRLGGVDALLPVFTNAAAATARSNRPFEVTAERLVLTNNYVSLTGGVTGRELPATGAEKRFRAGQVLIELAPGGQRAQSANAVGDVVVEEGTFGATNGPAAYRRFEAGDVRAYLAPDTGALRAFDATTGVRVSMPAGWAAGGRAYYDAATDVVTLTNQPTASLRQARLTQAEALLWHRGTGTIEVIGSNTFEVQPGGALPTNALPKFNFR